MRPRSIPPITSTGTNRSNTTTRLNGLAHVSLGRYMAEIAKNRKAEDDQDSWTIPKYTKSGSNQKKYHKPVKHNTVPNIKCMMKVIENYNEEGDVAVTLQFTGFEFTGDTFESIGNGTRSFSIPVQYQQKPATLCVMTIGDIFEYEIVNYNGMVKRICCDEIYIPELLQIYDSLSMRVALKENCIVVTYKINK